MAKRSNATHLLEAYGPFQKGSPVAQDSYSLKVSPASSQNLVHMHGRRSASHSAALEKCQKGLGFDWILWLLGPGARLWHRLWAQGLENREHPLVFFVHYLKLEAWGSEGLVDPGSTAENAAVFHEGEHLEWRRGNLSQETVHLNLS